MVDFEMLSWVGTVSFAVSGAVVAMEEEYDAFGVYFLGMTTAFGGGAIRNLLIGQPVSLLWEQQIAFVAALIAITVIYVLPRLWSRYLRSWTFFDAVGLAAFAIQGALLAVELDLPVVAVAFAALLTGAGGGMLRDVLANRKPLVFREEIYGVWALLGGAAVGLGWGNSPSKLFILAALIVILRIMSVHFGWRLPRRQWIKSADKE